MNQHISAVVVFVFASTLQLGARQLTQAVWVFPQQSDAPNPVSDAAGRSAEEGQRTHHRHGAGSPNFDGQSRYGRQRVPVEWHHLYGSGRHGYADRRDENNMILARLEMSNCAPGCGTNVTFYPDGQSVLHQQTLAVAEHFHAGSAFGSFAFHRYQDAYLSGIPGWLAIKGGQ